jgi:ionotropic glutamate receptor
MACTGHVLYSTNKERKCMIGTATWLLGSWGVVAMCGPQSSSVAHFVSHLAARTQVPLVSFGATNPTLSEQQYPYFTRLVWSDLLQMSAIAALIKYYAWREIMVLYIEDNYGKNGADVLEDLIDQIGSRIVFKAGFDPTLGNDTIATVLSQLKLLESRVYVVHMHQAMARTVFLVANYLKMMSPGYVWIVTDSVASSLDSTNLDLEFVRATQGVIGTRMYIPKTVQLLAYLMQRNNATGRTDLHYYSYELLAYESLWMIAYALDRFLQQGNSFEFVASDFPSDMPGGNSDLAQLKVLANGDVLLQHIRNTSFIGITGLVKLDERGDAKGISFEIVNRVGTGLNVVGYWVNGSGCSSTPPPFQIDGLVHEVVTGSGNTEASGKLQDVTWPGGVSTVPRGWVVPKNGMPLTIGVPIKIGYPEFVSAKTDSAGVTTYHGFCIDVFETAITYLPYAVSYKFVPFGNGSVMPNYNELIEKIVTKVKRANQQSYPSNACNSVCA